MDRIQSSIRVVLPILLGLAIMPNAKADLIFDNTAPTGTSIITTSSAQLGEEVTGAAGTGRVVTEVDLGFNSQGLAATANLQAFLYANGAPGTLLWSSAVMTDVAIDSRPC